MVVKMVNKLTYQYKVPVSTVQKHQGAVQKHQVTVDTKNLRKERSMYHTSEWHKLPLSSKVCKYETK